MKTIPICYCVNVVQPEQRRGDLLKIEGNGMGFVLIHRSVFYNIAKTFQILSILQDQMIVILHLHRRRLTTHIITLWNIRV